MIGIFGVRRAEAQSPADAAAMAKTVLDTRYGTRYAASHEAGAGADLGVVGHGPSDSRRARSRDGGGIVVLAGSIFNIEAFPDLQPRPASAAELVLRLLEAGTIDRLKEIDGQFCAAYYEPASHRLVLMTDRLASFPVHCWTDRGEVRFATQIYTLLGDRQVPRRADGNGIAQLFSMQRMVGDATNIAGVRALPGATVWEAGPSGVREDRYWHLRWRAPAFDRRGAAKELARSLRGAVARQRAANGSKAALLLSGGIDSRLVLAATCGNPPRCVTTASFKQAYELEIARGIAGIFGAPHETAIVEPAETFASLDSAVIESNGLYPASTPIAAFMPHVSADTDCALTGHGLDYTARGMYLPYRRLNTGRSTLRLPCLSRVPRRPTGAYVLRNLRHGPALDEIDRIIRPERRAAWWNEIEQAMEDTLAPWLDSDEPANAWDALIVQSVSRHYTFTGMMSVRAATNLAIPAFDNEVMDVYLQSPPAWRTDRRLANRALGLLSRDAAAYPSANTGTRADLEPWLEISGVLGRAALRRLGLGRTTRLPSGAHSHGSWQNAGALYRENPAHRQRLVEIKDRLDALSFGLLDTDILARFIDDHMEGRANHAKVLRSLMSHDVWVRRFGIEGHA